MLSEVWMTIRYHFKDRAHLYVGQQSLERIFEPSQQTWKLFKEQAPRMVITWVTIALIIVTLKAFENDGNVSHNYKYIFNAIMTVLSLILGLNFLEAFKDMAKVLRWRVLAKSSYNIQEIDLILGGESLLKLLRLMGVSVRRPLLVFACAFWIFLNLAAQGSIAVMGLTYSMDAGYASNGTYTERGMIDLAKLDCYHDYQGICRQVERSGMAVAHTLGQLIRGQRACSYANDSDISGAPQECYYFSRTDNQEFAYRFLEYNPKDPTHSYPYLTNRSIRTSTGICNEYAVNWSRAVTVDTSDGREEAYRFPIQNQTFNGTITIPRPKTGRDTTTYVYNGTLMPQDEVAQSCGPRCLWMYAFRSSGSLSNRTSAVFQCPITVSETYNATFPYHDIPAEVARLAAASIGLEGRSTDPDGDGPGKPVWTQYQFYAWGSDWEVQDLDAQEVGSRMAQYALGSIAGMVTLNPLWQQPGTLPILGYHLETHWNYVIAIAAVVAGLHTVFVALMLWVARPIVVVDDSHLCNARLLQGLVGRLGDGGNLLDGPEIARAIQERVWGDGEREREAGVSYGVNHTEVGAVHTIGLGEDIAVRKNLPRRRFPKGLYS